MLMEERRTWIRKKKKKREMYGAHHDRVDKVQSHCCLALGHVLSWSCVSGGTWWPPLYIISYVGRRLTFIVKPNSINNRVRSFWLLRVRTMTLSICLCCYIIDAINWSLPNGSISSSWLAPFPHNPSSSSSPFFVFLFFESCLFSCFLFPDIIMRSLPLCHVSQQLQVNFRRVFKRKKRNQRNTKMGQKKSNEEIDDPLENAFEKKKSLILWFSIEII